MGLDSLNKDTSGASLVQNFKDVFPGKLEKLYIYRGINLVSKGNEVFSREDTKTFIALELLKEVEIIYGGQAMTSTVRTITESKSVKETARQKVSTDSVTAFFRDLGDEVDLTDHNLYYTVKQPFVQGDLTQDQLEVLSDAQIVPNLLEKLISGTAPISNSQKSIILNNKTASFTLSPAVLDNNLPASEVRFVDEEIYKNLPVDEKDFEITSIDLESDQTLALEYRNGIKARGIIEDGTGARVEEDLDFRMDKPLMPLQVNPYSKFSNIQFTIENFNYYQRMPYLSARHFLGNDRKISTFISGGKNLSLAENLWLKQLIEAIVDMFKMSWAISTGFKAYRTGSDNSIADQEIGGVSLKSMEGKDPDKLYSYVDQILRNWEYKKNIQYKTTEEYKRALQVLAASSEVIESSYCVGKGLTEFHKSIFDYWLNLDTSVSEVTTDIEMTLHSDKYVFTYEETSPGVPDLTKPIINLKPISGISRSYVTNYGRKTSLGELDDPISISGFNTFAGDIDPTKADATKYFVGVDVTDKDKIAQMLGQEEEDKPEPHHVNKVFDSSWYAGRTKYVNLYGGGETGNDLYQAVAPGQSYEGAKIIDSGIEVTGILGSSNNPSPDQIIITDEQRNKFIMDELNIPSNAFNVVVNFDNVQQQNLFPNPEWKYNAYKKSDDSLWTRYIQVNKSRGELSRFTGTIVNYDVMTTVHGVKDKKENYDKGEFLNMIIKFADSDIWKRNFELDSNWRDDKDKQIAKIKSLDHLFISSFLGNYIDIKLNYKYTDDQDAEVTGTTLLPRIDLPAKDDERRTKLTIRL